MIVTILSTLSKCKSARAKFEAVPARLQISDIVTMYSARGRRSTERRCAASRCSWEREGGWRGVGSAGRQAAPAGDRQRRPARRGPAANAIQGEEITLNWACGKCALHKMARFL
ncbi:hypothetical protein O3G_MSEX003639 [Manduca sexta]|uniref:Uncharacterized protein n=1 Tax=Manduca sexta TaxID=7130 RepID=A0A922CFD6_MANSE|nr:hypothetical protein O3G_MSEX003639 [Manduca sexta]